MSNDFFAVIMAGGQGTRLWPLSRKSRPKQFLRLAGAGQSLIQAAVERASRVFGDIQRVMVVAPLAQAELVRQHLPNLPAENLILEPIGRNTAAAIGLAAVAIHQRNADGVMGVFPADHLFQDEKPWKDAVQTALEFAADSDQLVTIGLEPESSSPSYGYLHLGGLLTSTGKSPVYKVNRFVEKPTVEAAQTYLDSGEYLWNTGTFAWKVATLMRGFQQHLPGHYHGFQQIMANPDSWDVLAKEYPSLENISIDYGLMERSSNIAVVKANFERIDLGNLLNLSDLLEGSGRSKWSKDDFGNSHLGNGLIVSSSNTLIYDDTNEGITIAFGLDDVILIRQKDVVLALPKCEAHRIKDLLAEMRVNDLEHFL